MQASAAVFPHRTWPLAESRNAIFAEAGLEGSADSFQNGRIISGGTTVIGPISVQNGRSLSRPAQNEVVRPRRGRFEFFDEQPKLSATGRASRRALIRNRICVA